MPAHARIAPTVTLDAGLAKVLEQYRAARRARHAARHDADAFTRASRAEDYAANVLALAIDLRVGG